MANLIDTSFFVGEIAIPNSDTPAVKERIDWFITKYEEECLLIILGQKLYNLFVAEPTNQIIKDIINGAEYEDYFGTKYKWHGLVRNTNMSLIANYIYYYFMQSAAIHNTGVSTSISETESGKSVWPVEKMIEAWNQFSREVKGQLIPFLLRKKDQNGDFTYSDYFKISDSVAVISRTRPINMFGL